MIFGQRSENSKCPALFDLGEKEDDMGGWGSGWRGPKKDTVEGSLVISIKTLAQIGALNPGTRTGTLRCSGQPSIEYSTSMDSDRGTIWLKYTAYGQFMHYAVSLVTTVPHYGGRRWWFICPIKKIRVSKVYLPPGATQFASRKAHSLTYRSSQESGRRERSEKFWRRVAQRLGGNP
jgi:hypothetical protein